MNLTHRNVRGRAGVRPALAPITRAIRQSLFASATLLALSLPASALADAACRSDANITRCVPASARTLPEALHDPSIVGDGASLQPLQAGVLPLAATDYATGVVVIDPYSAVLDNADAIAVSAQASGNAVAYGLVASSGEFSYLTNAADGSVDASAYSVSGMAQAVAAYAVGGDGANLWNYGELSATVSTVSGVAQAYAAAVISAPSGIGLLINGGSLNATAQAGDDGLAYASGGYVLASVATAINDASVDVSASAGANGGAIARGIASNGMYAASYNYGDISVSASAGLAASATGIDANGHYGATAYNAGDIAVDASAPAGVATAFGSHATAAVYDAYSTNHGSIDVVADGDSAIAVGIFNTTSFLGNAITHTDGSVSASATGGLAPYGEIEATAYGVFNYAFAYDSQVYNGGTISASAVATDYINVQAGMTVANAIGAEAANRYGLGITAVVNTGTIQASADVGTGRASAWAAVAKAVGQYADVAIDNQGALYSYAHADIGVVNAVGAYAATVGGIANVVNTGDVVAVAQAERGVANVTVDYAYAVGVKAISLPYGGGSVVVDNEGQVEAHASGFGVISGATGIQVYGINSAVTNGQDATIIATGSADGYGGGFATGINAGGVYGVSVLNAGDIEVSGQAHGLAEGPYTHYGASRTLGIYAAAGMQGNVYVGNTGSISVHANSMDSVTFFNGGAAATGIHVYAKYDGSVVNGGDVEGIAQSELGIVSAYGVVDHGKYTSHVLNQAGASIVASATAGSLITDTDGGRAVSTGIHVFGADHAYVENDGSVLSHAEVTADGGANASLSIARASGISEGAYSHGLTAELVNNGDISADATAEFGGATSYGSYQRISYAAQLENSGSILSSASADHGDAWAVGSFAYARHQSMYVPCNGYYCYWDQAVYTVDNGVVSLDNVGLIRAQATAEGGLAHAYGAVLLGAFGNDANNAGQLIASAEGDDATAIGLLALSGYGATSVTNSGLIAATATGTTASATGVKLQSAGTSTLDNSGTIAAYGDGVRNAVDASAGGALVLTNSGTLIGAVLSGSGDDSLDNAASGTWLALGNSDFGDGSDAISNAGTLLLQEATLTLGDDGASNSFANTGMLQVSGADNLIDMGGAFAFANNGTISWLDAAADDVLTIAGGFDGHGSLQFDADLAQQAGDRLVLAGDMAAGSQQTVDVNVFGMPTAAHERIELVTASGALAGSFTLGTLHASGSEFITQQFALSHTAQSVALESDVTGLDDAGSLAASIASGAAGLLNAQVGTLRQRLGSNPYGDAGQVLSAFVRYYSDQNTVNPTHLASDFGPGGHFDYDLTSWGSELGVNANLTDQLHVGLTVGAADGRQHLTGAGVDSNRLHGMSWGWYATWVAPQGFYLDVSGRWMAADVRSTAVAGSYQTRTHASAWSVEAGYQWQIGGLSVVPQLQYTRTRVDEVDVIHGTAADFAIEGGSSRRGRIGVEVSKTFTTASGLRWTPYGSLNAVREFDGAMGYAVNAAFHGQVDTAGSSAMVALGVGVQKAGWSLDLGAHWVDGGALKGGLGGQAILRYRW